MKTKTYKNINDEQKNKMKAICNNSYKMEWEYHRFMDILLGKMPIYIHHVNIKDTKLKQDLCTKEFELQRELDQYDYFKSDKKEFLDKIQKLIENIRNMYPNWYGLEYQEIVNYIEKQKFCLIYGEGGIGKSFFIKEFEEELEKINIEHLCIYGKFKKNVTDIDIDEINELDKGFVFVVDAVNEMSSEGQEELINLLEKLKPNPRIRIVLTYRTNTVKEHVIQEFKKLGAKKCLFQGVSFRSALDVLTKKSVPDIYKYENILYTNNALLLNMLCDILPKNKIVDESENGTASITFIFESYVQDSAEKILEKKRKSGETKSLGKGIWESTKKIANWMYENNVKDISESDLCRLIKNKDEYIDIVEQLGLIGSFEYKGNRSFCFLAESMSDFLIVRSLLRHISNVDYEEQVKIIKEKREKLRNIDEQLIVAIFDKFGKHASKYSFIKKLLSETDLMDYFSCETILKINFKKENIKGFQEVFELTDINEAFEAIAGYADKPFNCVNYLMEYYESDFDNISSLSKMLSFTRFPDHLGKLKKRLKNIIYFVEYHSCNLKRGEETLYFAILCCAAPDKGVRYFATKLLYDLIETNDDYKNIVIQKYDILKDDYIREAIIFVLSKNKQSQNVKDFFISLISKDKTLCARSIKRISLYLGKECDYIHWKRENLYCETDKLDISDNLDSILLEVDMLNKDYLPFRYWSRNHIDLRTKFIKIKHTEIVQPTEFWKRLSQIYKGYMDNKPCKVSECVYICISEIFCDKFLNDGEKHSSESCISKTQSDVIQSTGFWEHQSKIFRTFGSGEFSDDSFIFVCKMLANKFKYEKQTETELLDTNSFLMCYENVLNNIFKKYKIDPQKNKPICCLPDNFENCSYMKVVDIATGIYLGSLMCNYYTIGEDEFETCDDNTQDIIGHKVYDPLDYGEHIILTSPVSTYSAEIERLDEDLAKTIERPDKKDFAWERDIKLKIKNIRSALKPIRNEWILLSGVIIFKGNGFDSRWEDFYCIHCCTSDLETIKNYNDARKLTIELDTYYGKLTEYKYNSDKPWLCKQVSSIINEEVYVDHIFDETSLVLPPAEIIKYFDLELDRKNMTWRKSNGDHVIICNNNENPYFTVPVTGSVYMKKQYYDQYVRENGLKYFAFAEQFVTKSLPIHFEIRNGHIEKEITNCK